MPSDDDSRYVLLVDDDEGIRVSLRMLLEDEAYRVIEAPDGIVAWDVLRTFAEPAVVITNHNMPRLDGPGLINLIQEESGVADRVALIYITAGNRVITPTLQQQLAHLSATTLRKPFDIEDMLRAVAAAAEHLKLKRERVSDPATRTGGK